MKKREERDRERARECAQLGVKLSKQPWLSYNKAAKARQRQNHGLSFKKWRWHYKLTDNKLILI